MSHGIADPIQSSELNVEGFDSDQESILAQACTWRLERRTLNRTIRFAALLHRMADSY
jgi:hypothetical protein